MDLLNKLEQILSDDFIIINNKHSVSILDKITNKSLTIRCSVSYFERFEIFIDKVIEKVEEIKSKNCKTTWLLDYVRDIFYELCNFEVKNHSFLEYVFFTLSNDIMKIGLVENKIDQYLSEITRYLPNEYTPVITYKDENVFVQFERRVNDKYTFVSIKCMFEHTSRNWFRELSVESIKIYEQNSNVLEHSGYVVHSVDKNNTCLISDSVEKLSKIIPQK